METKETIELRNPFMGNDLKIVKCVSENRLTREAVATMLETLEVEDENEFYVLFNTGILIKKERSKFRTSDYFKGGKMTKIKEVYNG
jgi:hypothetical protein